MKHMASVIPGMIILMLAGCATSGPDMRALEPDAPTTRGNSTSIRTAPLTFDPVPRDQLDGLALVGTDSPETEQVEFRTDGQLLLVIGGTAFEGTWRYEDTRPRYSLTLYWEDGVPPEEYVGRLIQAADEYILEARWYVADPIIRLYRRYVEPSFE
jgi:hypothetical protein